MPDNCLAYLMRRQNSGSVDRSTLPRGQQEVVAHRLETALPTDRCPVGPSMRMLYPTRFDAFREVEHGVARPAAHHVQPLLV